MPERLAQILGPCAIIGGTGFLGRHIARRLTDAGVNAIALARHSLAGLPVPLRQVSILDASGLVEALRGIRTVFHTASLCDVIKGTKPYWDVNVTGSRNVLEACRTAGVQNLVYTSTPSVVIGSENILDGDENLPYAKRFLAPYPETKAAAEQLLLAANSPDLRICALRPHLLWGKDDPHIIPRILQMGRRHTLRIIGDGTNLVSITHVENAAHAHIQAACELAGEGRCAGRPYFVNDDTPVRLWDWINDLLHRMGFAPATKRVGHALAYVIGTACECWASLPFTGAPSITRFVVNQLAHSHTFSHAAATRDFGYQMVVPPELGLQQILN
ncbi:MAG: NAD-dependent epimerase/dehydratase family protein [Victivallales bacterium]|nr:NAD-dependent epimerase/dehydratase family protein [Victivallales bacterium]